jgi:hypothetical protein
MNIKLHSILIFTLIFSYNLLAQNETISLLPNYTNQSFYSMENGEIKSNDATMWDIAFSTTQMSSSIRINGGMGAELYLYPHGDTTDWNSFNSSNLSSWTPVYNSDTNWLIGAFDKHSSSAFDMGWGMYNIITHNVVGDSLYAIKTTDGAWKKLWIRSLTSGTYYFTFSDFDGSNEQNQYAQKSIDSTANFLYYSLDYVCPFHGYEPNKNNWDITFTKYITPVQAMPYGVVGVLSNTGVEVAQVDNLPNPNTYTDYTQHTMMTEMNSIGYDWKDFDMSSFSYLVDSDRCYFVKDLNGRIWRIVFTSFEGSSTGIVEFNTQEISSSTSFENINQDLVSFEIYPNPTSNDVIIIYDSNSEDVNVNISDLTGKNIYSESMHGTNLQAKAIQTSSFNNGIYIVTIESEGSILQKKLIVN